MSILEEVCEEGSDNAPAFFEGNKLVPASASGADGTFRIESGASDASDERAVKEETKVRSGRKPRECSHK